jgi:CubicO group peptidase (beta-lactamase class C family)
MVFVKIKQSKLKKMKNKQQTRKSNQIITMLALLLTIGFSFSSCIKNQEVSSKKEKIDDLMSYCYENELFNGTVLIASNDEIIYQNALGFTNFDCKTPLQLNSVFSLASLSKIFTSVAIMILKEKGKLKYEDKLSMYFPDFPNADRITIWNLLTHTSGMGNYLDYGGVFRVEGKPGDFLDGVTNQKVYKYLKTIDSLRFTPGEKFEYSNSGYFLLSLVVEKVSANPFHIFMQEEIFTPLKMKNTYVISKPDLHIPNRAYGFTDYKDPDDDNLLTTGGAGIFSTVEDLLKWDKALSSETLISNKTLLEAFEIPVFNDGSLSDIATDSTWCYGMGWVFRITENDSIVFHDGGLNACTSMFYRDLKNRYTIIILSNKGSNLPIYPIHDELIKIMNNEVFDYPSIPISLKLNKMIEYHGVEKAVELCREFKANETSKFDFSTSQLNSLGYYYIGKQELGKAKAVLKLNVEFYPKNANVYDSYAESLMLSGDNENSIKYYKKSLELNPNNENAKQMLKRIENEK